MQHITFTRGVTSYTRPKKVTQQSQRVLCCATCPCKASVTSDPAEHLLGVPTRMSIVPLLV